MRLRPLLPPQHTLRPHCLSSRPSDSWARSAARRLGREERAPQSRARGAGRPSPSSRPSRRVPSPRVLPAECPCESASAGTFFDSWSLSRLPFPPRRGAGPYSGPRMQNVINTVKGKALEVAEYLTPVLKVSRAGLARGCQVHAQLCRDRGPGVGGVTVFSGGGRCRKVLRVGHRKRCNLNPWSYIGLSCSSGKLGATLCAYSCHPTPVRTALLGTWGWKVVRS